MLGESLIQYQEPPYALPETLLAPVTHNDPRDPYVAARDAATAPATDNDDSPTPKETSPSEPQGYSRRFVAMMGLEAANQIGWTEMRSCFNKSGNVPSERKKIDSLYPRGLTDNIKGQLLEPNPLSMNEAVRMAYARWNKRPKLE
ncbi:hypothetical protein Tco_1176089 [Tanacetum coccineum]